MACDPGFGPPVQHNSKGDATPFLGFSVSGDPIPWTTNAQGDIIPYELLNPTVTGDPAPFTFDSNGNRIASVNEFFGHIRQPMPPPNGQPRGIPPGWVAVPTDVVKAQQAEWQMAVESKRRAEHRQRVDENIARFGPSEPHRRELAAIEGQLRRRPKAAPRFQSPAWGAVLLATMLAAAYISIWRARYSWVPDRPAWFPAVPEFVPRGLLSAFVPWSEALTVVLLTVIVLRAVGNLRYAAAKRARLRLQDRQRSVQRKLGCGVRPCDDCYLGRF